MSALCHFHHDTMHNLKHIQRQMKLLDARLHLLRDRLGACRLHRLTCHRCCLHLPDCRCSTRRALAARMEMERRLDRLRRIGMMLSCCHSPCHLSCDPCDVSVCVRDGRVTVSSEHKEEHNSLMGKTCNYRRCTKEYCLPGPCDDDVTCCSSVECNSLMKIEPPKCCSHICDC